jgi:FK506-binding protein 4/5
MTKRIHVKGEGYATPNDGAIMDVVIEVFSQPGNDKLLSISEKAVVHGEESTLNLPKCVESIIDNMKKGEKCEVIVQPKHAFTAAHNRPEVPIGAPIKFEITLNSFEKAKESWEMNLAEKVENAKLKREKATAFLKSGQYDLAEKLFGKILKLLENESPGAGASSDDSSDEGEDGGPEGDDLNFSTKIKKSPEDAKADEAHAAEISEIVTAANLNLSLCYLKTEDFTKVIEYTDKVLENNELNEKALYRKAEALFKLHQYPEAKEAYSKVLAAAPTNASAKKRQVECDKKVLEEKRAEKARYERMFRNFST